jgi:hypothetical protein
MGLEDAEEVIGRARAGKGRSVVCPIPGYACIAYWQVEFIE